jgi:hypothetical protein
MVEGMPAEPWVLRGYQEARLREFRELLPVTAMGTPEPKRLIQDSPLSKR